MDTLTLSVFRQDVETVVAAGGVVTDEYKRLTARWDRFNAAADSPMDEFTTAIAGDATDGEMHQLYALTLAHTASNPAVHATVRNAAAAAIESKLRAEYRTVARVNYETLSDKFDAEADALAKCVAEVRPSLTPEQLVKLPKSKQTAWMDTKVHAAALDHLLPNLLAAGHHGGIVPKQTTPDVCIPLTVDVTGLHYRRVWEAWHINQKEAHGGRWTALLQLGASVRAHEFKKVLPRALRPIETRYVRSNFGHRPIEFDPEDPNAPRDAITVEAAERAVNASA